jgi:hypothetical protein
MDKVTEVCLFFTGFFLALKMQITLWQSINDLATSARPNELSFHDNYCRQDYEAKRVKLVSRGARRKNLEPTDRCFRYVEIMEQPRLFIADIGHENETETLWTHFIIVRLDDLLQVLENAETTRSKVRITLQTAFSSNDPYQLSEVTQ